MGAADDTRPMRDQQENGRRLTVRCKKNISAPDRPTTYLLTSPVPADLAIAHDLQATLVSHPAMICFGGLCVACIAITYAIFIEQATGIALLLLAIAGTCQRLVFTQTFKASLQAAPVSGSGFVISGLLWSMVVGVTGGLCALTGRYFIILMASCVISALSFGALFLNAAAPRFAKIQNLVLVGPFFFSIGFTTIPHVEVIFFQLPVWVGGAMLIIDKAYRVVAELTHAKRRIAFLASHDPLTGLYNRSHIADTIEKCSLRVRGDDGATDYLLYMDLDSFKRVNDTYGHASGDELLKMVGARITASLRQGDFLARIGGDEFVAVIRNMKREEIYGLARRIARQVEEPFALDNAVDICIGISIGGTPIEPESPGTLLDRADSLLYKAKHAGGDTVDPPSRIHIQLDAA